MANVTAAMVKELRDTTGAGMLDCKKALVESDGDIEAAIDWLRQKGLSKAAKKSSRVAAEGLVSFATDGAKGAVIELNSETDFVSRNETFQKVVGDIAGLSLQAGGDIDTLLGMDYPGTGRNVGDEVTHQVATIGENMNLRRTAMLEVSDGVVTGYMHNAVTPSMGKIAVLVALESAGDKAKLEGLAKQIAMHVAATNPASTSVDDLDPALLEREKNVLTEQARESGKPDNIIEKMIVGRIQKYYEEVVLTEQVFVIDGENRVKDVIASLGKEIGADVALKGFIRFELGDGIEKEEGDFAAEVAAAVSGS
ncbi:MAG: elongation factor Ts [Alphaproteobacteria bacterium TMED89]|nr:elongation factor Ts [Rhodospirillaceae bacterium]RPH14880.1 MAG: elongation factor Ts [Alphaproteobacteria bacterium TMED89]